jgi:hypothetical protein
MWVICWLDIETDRGILNQGFPFLQSVDLQLYIRNANSQTTININLSWQSSMCQAKLAALLVSVRSNSRRKSDLLVRYQN